MEVDKEVPVIRNDPTAVLLIVIPVTVADAPAAAVNDTVPLALDTVAAINELPLNLVRAAVLLIYLINDLGTLTCR